MTSPTTNSSAGSLAFPLRGKTVVVGVGGGIAAYKACELVRLLIKADAKVRVVMTPGAQKFVQPLTFQALTGHAVFTDLFSLEQESTIGHISLADQADLMIIAPATANLLARMAAGMATDALTACWLATKAPTLVAPSMNVNMWQHPMVAANVERLRPHVAFVGPDSGFLACGWTGRGRLADPDMIAHAAERLLAAKDLVGRRILVSAGPTHEPIDAVRFLSNKSTGKMGFALAEAAAQRGASVTVIAGPTGLSLSPDIARIDVQTAQEMDVAIHAEAPGADVVIMAAAVADFRVKAPAREKQKRGALGKTMALPLVQNRDILASLGALASRKGSSPRPVLVGFAAETSNLVAAAKQKLTGKGCDYIVANDVSQPDAGFGVDTNRVIVVSPRGTTAVPLASKREIAHAILTEVSRRPPAKTKAAASAPRPKRR
ncbi:MAG: bifunctional phosphopantothenoylcysteine decarboxylase/phosphopantothenate--cysteine ligase CoaBC [Myxococcales bacterium]|nr:bifunctional phosphopantothenoylcysteine decarboxylase/phosphopantothenate--cysteine ligase CoaBC [Myxococcales bacterium]